MVDEGVTAVRTDARRQIADTGPFGATGLVLCRVLGCSQVVRRVGSSYTNQGGDDLVPA